MSPSDVDQTYAELKHKSVIESLDARCESLKRKNGLMRSENELLRSELAVLQAAGTPLEDQFTNSKIYTYFD